MNKKAHQKSIVLRRRILQLNRMGKRSTDIALELGTSSENVVRHLRLAGAMMTPYGSECKFAEPTQRRIVCEYLMGMSVDKLGEKYKCADYRIQMVLWKYGLPERPVLELVRRKQAVWMSQSGMSMIQIGSCFGYSPDVVERWFREENFIPENPSLLKPEQKTEAIKLSEAGYSYFAIGKRLKMSPNSVRNLVLASLEKKQ